MQTAEHADNTRMIYTSDHGDMTGNHGIWGKSYMYEGSVGVPLTFGDPGIDPATNTTPVSLTDLSATIERAVTDQAKRIAELGGLDAIRNMPSFNHTPLEQD